jgi:acetoacetate decarboxylase
VTLAHDEGWTTPVDSPYYPRLPAVYRSVRIQLAFFRANPGGVARFLPEPLVASAQGLCVAAGMDVPFCTSYGAFREIFLLLGCSFESRAGFYCSHVFHDGPAGIAAGREIYGTPKLFASVSVRQRDRAFASRARLGGETVISVSTATDRIVPASAIPALTPSWRLKLIPRADGAGLDVKQLIDGASAVQDQEVHFCAQGTGTVRLGKSALINLTPLEPVADGNAFYMECSYSEHFGTIVYDYLKHPPHAAATRTASELHTRPQQPEGPRS